MTLTPTELDRLTLFTAAELARRYRRDGIRLSHPEAVALLGDEIITAARRGLSQPDLVAFGAGLLTTDDVMPGVAAMIPLVSVEVDMAEGTKLVTVFDPIRPGTTPESGPVPGELLLADGEIELNPGRDRVAVTVVNRGDRTIQVRSHAHFFETNRALLFDRARAFGRRLDTASGTGVRFEPGVAKTVTLVPFAGTRVIRGGGGLTAGALDDAAVRTAALAAARARGYGDTGEIGSGEIGSGEIGSGEIGSGETRSGETR